MPTNISTNATHTADLVQRSDTHCHSYKDQATYDIALEARHVIRVECGSKASDSCKANSYNSFSFPPYVLLELMTWL